MLLVNIDLRLVASGQYLADLCGRPELVRFRRFPRGLCATIGSRWIALSGCDLRDMTVVGRLLGINESVE